ncbi:MAG: YeiH family protein [Treponema sp.]|jgi:uncharacterized integral membrane protein (TIGR00698 family)|nr:YeiH family protein [Treponema sp.]
MQKIFGIFFCLIIATPSWIIGRRFPLIGGPVIAILTGIVLSALFPFLTRRPRGIVLTDGIQFTSKKILQYAIILLGFEMNMFNVIQVGGISLFVMLFTFLAAFMTAFCAGRLLKLPGNITILIGVGTSICGGSAIAAAAPVIRADDDDVVRAISTIFLFNIIAVFIFPPLGRLAGMNDTQFGIWAGTAINDTSSVVAAGTAWSSAAENNTALNFATIVKLTRALMIVPTTLFLALYTARKIKNSGEGNFKLRRVFPWFVLFFLMAAILNTIFTLPPGVSSTLVQAGKFGITMAMASIGLNTNLKKLISSGVKPIILGTCCWFSVAVVSLLVQQFIS